MKIDNDKLTALAALPDEELWQTVCAIGKSHGFKLPEKTPPHSQLQKMRDAITKDGKPNLREAIKIINDYRNGRGGNNV